MEQTAMIVEYGRPRADNSSVSRVRSILTKSRIPAIRRVEADEDGNRIILRGQVPLYYYKQLAQELIRNELTDSAIVNEIEVIAPR
jgi:hypothetical protein